MARGIDTGVGPVVVRALFTDRRQWPRVRGGAVSLCGLCYAAVALVPWTSTPCRHLHTSGARSRGERRERGPQYRPPSEADGGPLPRTGLFHGMAPRDDRRVLSIFVGSGLLELDWLTREKAILAFGLLQVASGLAWLFVVVPREQHAQAQEAALTNEPPAATRSVDSSR
jgi:hypothetical protein